MCNTCHLPVRGTRISLICITDILMSTHAHYYIQYIIAAAIAIHNFPEGIAAFVVGLATPRLGIALAIAIAVHNIPEGMQWFH